MKRPESRSPNAAPASRTSTKIIVSLLAFGAVFAVSWTLAKSSMPAEVVVTFGTSLFVAGVTFVVQFLLDVERRLDRMGDELTQHAAANETRIAEGFQRINEANRLFGLIEASALKTDAITQLVGNSVRVKPNPSLVFDLAQTEIQRLSEMLKTLGDSGDLTYEGEDRDWLLGLTRHVNDTIDAVSSTLDLGDQDFFDSSVWQSDLGQRYLEAQREAIRRNVRVRRIFVLDRPNLRDDAKFRRLVQMHDDVSIEVRALDPTLFPGQYIPPIFDFIVFDGVVSYQTLPSAPVNELNRLPVATTQLVTSPARVQRNIDLFNELWRIATPVS